MLCLFLLKKYLLVDSNNSRVIIIEAKESKRESDMESDCRDAGEQIISRRYSKDLVGYETILSYGISFFKNKPELNWFVKKKLQNNDAQY